MDSELVKLILSVVSAVVAVISAIAAYRIRVQTRKDLFEAQRDILLLTLSENDARLKTLEFRTQLLSRRLSETLGRSNDDTPDTENLVGGLRELTQVARSLQRRDWTEGGVRTAKIGRAHV